MGHSSCSSPREWMRGGVIGVGAFGTVSLALDKVTGELLAVKSIECKEDRKGELLSMDNEINILKRLDSPWIVKFLGANYSENGGVCRRNLLMEYMPGGSVSDVVQRFGGQLEESVIRVYTRGILKGIEYLHSQGIVHSDIKGKNVLVGSVGVKLADFGSARIGGSEEGSKAGLSGTPLWMAPEVVNQVERGPPCDIWSLGCTVVEMATGRPPWSNIDHPLAAMYKIGCSDELPAFPKSLSAEAHDFLDKCFRRDPKQRWTSVQLLTHPFVTQCSQQEPVSPTSALDFHSVEKEWDESCFCATFSRTIPVLSLHRKQHSPMQGKEEAGHSDSEAKRVFEESPRPNSKPSPCQRMKELAEKYSSSTRPNWSLSPDSNWIVVRSPKHNKPLTFDTITDFVNSSLAQSTPSAQTSQADCGASSQISGIICEDLSGTDEYLIDEGLSTDVNTPTPFMNYLSPCTSNDESGSQDLCISMKSSVFYSKLGGPESSADVVDIHEKKHAKNLSLPRLRSKLLKFRIGTQCAVVNFDMIEEVMMRACLNQKCTSEQWHWRRGAHPPYSDLDFDHVIAVREDCNCCISYTKACSPPTLCVCRSYCGGSVFSCKLFLIKNSILL